MNTFIDLESKLKKMCLFDYVCYLTIVRHIYGPSITEDDIKKLDPLPLQEFLTAGRENNPLCNLDLKQKKVIRYMEEGSLDIFFLQEATIINTEE